MAWRCAALSHTAVISCCLLTHTKRRVDTRPVQFPTVQVRQRGKMLSQYQPGSYFLESMMKWLDPVLGGRAMPAKKPAGRKKSGSKRIEL